MRSQIESLTPRKGKDTLTWQTRYNLPNALKNAEDVAKFLNEDLASMEFCDLLKERRKIDDVFTYADLSREMVQGVNFEQMVPAQVWLEERYRAILLEEQCREELLDE